MIFSIVCEEFGLVGAVLLMLLFVLLVWRLYSIALHVQDLFGCLVVTGIMGHILIQVILNIAVVTNTIPNTRHHSALRQLWRYLGFISSVGNGACAEYIPQSPPRGARHMLMV